MTPVHPPWKPAPSEGGHYRVAPLHPRSLGQPGPWCPVFSLSLSLSLSLPPSLYQRSGGCAVFSLSCTVFSLPPRPYPLFTSEGRGAAQRRVKKSERLVTRCFSCGRSRRRVSHAHVRVQGPPHLPYAHACAYSRPLPATSAGKELRLPAVRHR
jgi:hypothetical protein